MRLGLLYEIEAPRPGQQGSLHDELWQTLDQVKLAEQSGFDSVFAVERLAFDGAPAASAPEVWLAAVAQHTERVRLGYGVRLLPFGYHSPIRAAESAAVLDIMGEGRLELGASRAEADALETVGVDQDELRTKWDEALAMLPRMWMDESFSWASEHFEMPPRNVLPKPVQAPHPPLWMWGAGPDAAGLAAQRGVGFLQLPTADATGIGNVAKRYGDAIGRAKPVGAAIHRRFAACAPLFCGRDDVDATARAKEAVCGTMQRVAGPERPRDLAGLVDRHAVLVGSPERCLESIEWLRSQGVDELLFVVRMGALAHEDICDSLRRFGAEVIPHVGR